MVKLHTAKSSLLLVAHAALFDASHAAASSSSSSSSASSSPSSQPQVDGTLLVKIENDENLYSVQLEVGTPPQSVQLQLDTGSSDLWVPGANSSVCLAGQCVNGEYNMSESSTAELYIYDGFKVAYVDTSYANGSYITDVVNIGGVEVSDVTMGYASGLHILTYGLIGVGYKDNEGDGSQKVFPNFPYQLCLDNITNTVAYSLWLDDRSANTGNILFGGIDRSKYIGDLTILDFWPSSSTTTTITEFQVAFSGLRAVSASGTDNLGSSSFPHIALLDSGTSLTYLPIDLAYEVFNVTGAFYNATADVAWVPCTLANATEESTYLSYEFGGVGGAVVNVSMSDVVLTDNVNEDDDSLCEFGILPNEPTTSHVILGDTFLRSAYIVYDLVNDQAGMAQTNRDASASDESQIVSFVSSGAPIPFATLAPNQGKDTGEKVAVTTTLASFAAASGFANPPTSTSSSSSAAKVTSTATDGDKDSSSSSSSSSSSNSSGDKSKEKAAFNVNGWAIGGGAAAGVLVLASGAYAWRAMANKKRNRMMKKGQLGSMDGGSSYESMRGVPVGAPAGIAGAGPDGDFEVQPGHGLHSGGGGGGDVVDEAKAPLVPTEQEYDRLTQVQTAYRDV